MRPRLLDLFCGAGGAAMGYHRAGFEVVGVDIKPQPNYPFEFFQADAIEYLDWLDGGGFDAIHASPPCQAYTSLRSLSTINHVELIPDTRAGLERTGLPWVIENVPGAPLIEPVQLCGSAFNLGVRRHRLFEANFPLMGAPCAHGYQDGKFDVYEHGKWRVAAAAPVFGTGGGKAKERWGEAMGIDWMTHTELGQAIPPAYTEHIGHFLLRAVRERQAA